MVIKGITSETGRLSLQYRGPHIWYFLNSKVKLSRNSIDSFKDILRKFSFDTHNFSFNKEAIMMKTKDNDYVYYQLLAIGFYDECLFSV